MGRASVVSCMRCLVDEAPGVVTHHDCCGECVCEVQVVKWRPGG